MVNKLKKFGKHGCNYLPLNRSHPYKSGALKDLLKAQEVSLLRDIHEAIEKRVENRISTARRFAVRNLVKLQ